MAPPPGPRPHSTVAPLREDEGAVSPVIGTIMILAITVIGIAGVMAYGAPTIDRIQSRNAQTAMEGSFETLRDNIQELSVPDHARQPSVQLSSGTLGLKAGTRIEVAADHDSANTACDLHVTDWQDSGTDKDKVTLSASGCRSPSISCTYPMASGTACLEVDAVTGSTLTRQGITSFSGGVVRVSSADFSKGDWLFRLTNANTNPTTYAEAWLASSDQVTWDLASGTGRYQEFFDAGAVFSQLGGTYYLEKEAPIGDATFGTGYYGLWLRTLIVPNGNYVAYTGSGSHSVSLTLLGVATRVDDPSTYKLRFDFSGELSESWCKSLLLRNARFGLTSPSAAYTEDGANPCKNSNASALRSVTFACLTCSGAGHPFKFRFLHARVATSLST